MWGEVGVHPAGESYSLVPNLKNSMLETEERADIPGNHCPQELAGNNPTMAKTCRAKAGEPAQSCFRLGFALEGFCEK